MVAIASNKGPWAARSPDGAASASAGCEAILAKNEDAETGHGCSPKPHGPECRGQLARRIRSVRALQPRKAAQSDAVSTLVGQGIRFANTCVMRENAGLTTFSRRRRQTNSGRSDKLKVWVGLTVASLSPGVPSLAPLFVLWAAPTGVLKWGLVSPTGTECAPAAAG